MNLSNKAYDTLKFFALVLLPGISAAYVTLAQVWNFPNPEAVVGTLTVIDTLLGLLLKNSSANYEDPTKTVDGELVLSTDPTDGTLGMGVSADVKNAAVGKDSVTLRVVKTSPGTIQDYQG